MLYGQGNGYLTQMHPVAPTIVKEGTEYCFKRMGSLDKGEEPAYHEGCNHQDGFDDSPAARNHHQ